MYALPNKTQHKLIAKVRGGISQKVDNFYSPNQGSSNSNENSSETSSHSRIERQAKLSLNRLDDAGFDAELSHMPQPVFHSISQNGNKQRPPTSHYKVPKQYITPEHNEMIKYVQRSWKGVERDYKKSVNNFINNIDLNSSSPCSPLEQQKRVVAAVGGSTKKKTAAISTPLLLSGSYHHTSTLAKEGADCKQDSFRPFDLEAFWGNRILKRLTAEM